MASVRRKIKNFIFSYTEAQKKIREATSNDPWAATAELLKQIADHSFSPKDLNDMMIIVWKRMNDAGYSWRHVYKSLVLLEYLLLKGSDQVVQHCKENVYSIQVLKDFRYIEDGKDHGLRIREKSKTVCALVKDSELLKQERTRAQRMKDREIIEQTNQSLAQPTTSKSATVNDVKNGNTSDGSPLSYGASPNVAVPMLHRRNARSFSEAVPTTVEEEEAQVQMALELSRQESLRIAREAAATANAKEDSRHKENITGVTSAKAHCHKSQPFRWTADQQQQQQLSNCISDIKDTYRPRPSTKSFDTETKKPQVKINSEQEPWGTSVCNGTTMLDHTHSYHLGQTMANDHSFYEMHDTEIMHNKNRWKPEIGPEGNVLPVLGYDDFYVMPVPELIHRSKARAHNNTMHEQQPAQTSPASQGAVEVVSKWKTSPRHVLEPWLTKPDNVQSTPQPAVTLDVSQTDSVTTNLMQVHSPPRAGDTKTGEEHEEDDLMRAFDELPKRHDHAAVSQNNVTSFMSDNNRKRPEDFLGEHSSLINLDNLVARRPGFAADTAFTQPTRLTSNPFLDSCGPYIPIGQIPAAMTAAQSHQQQQQQSDGSSGTPGATWPLTNQGQSCRTNTNPFL